MTADLRPLPTIVLASASPRRADVLRQLGLDPVVRPAEVDEARLAGEAPAAYVERLARAKAEAAGRREAGTLVIGGDTIVVDGREVLGKPVDEEDAVRMLLGLSGRTHDVLSGIAIAGPTATISAVADTRVTFRKLGEASIRAYVRTGEPMDKAGAYGIQGRGAALVEGIEGDFYAVMGFPVAAFLDLLDRAGYHYDFGPTAAP